MKNNLNKITLVLVLIFLIALIIRLYQFSFFEYKGDQFTAIDLGNHTRASHFLITKGRVSWVGLDIPPAFPYAMGFLTAFTNDPARLTFCFFCINVLALILAFIYFYLTLPVHYAVLSAVFLGLSPAFTIYTSNIWEQLFLPLIMILFNINLYEFIRSNHSRNFFFLGVLAVLAAQFHLSGFFLFPVIIVITAACWKKINKKTFQITLLTALFLFIPFLIHLFKDNEITKFITYGSALNRPFPWDILLWHIRMASYDFFRYYFRTDFYGTLIGIAGDWRYILYPLTFIPAIFFILGFASYLKWLIKTRTIFDTSENTINNYPLPFQISGLMVLVVSLGYFALRVHLYMHYFIILFPAYSIISGFTALKLWRSSAGKILVLLGILSTVILLICTLLFLDRAGGHPDEYGISYKALTSWKNELRSMKTSQECFNLNIILLSKANSDTHTILSVLNNNNQCGTRDKIIPARIYITWNKKQMRFEHSFVIGPTP